MAKLTESELAQRFGPKLFSAMVKYIAKATSKTEKEVLDGISDELVDENTGREKIEDYNWMGEV